MILYIYVFFIILLLYLLFISLFIIIYILMINSLHQLSQFLDNQFILRTQQFFQKLVGLFPEFSMVPIQR